MEWRFGLRMTKSRRSAFVGAGELARAPKAKLSLKLFGLFPFLMTCTLPALPQRARRPLSQLFANGQDVRCLSEAAKIT